MTAEGPQDGPEVPRIDVGTLEPVEPVTPAATAAVEGPEVVGLNGRPAQVPTGVWYAATDGQGGLLTDEDGRPVRVRSPHRPPAAPLGG